MGLISWQEPEGDLLGALAWCLASLSASLQLEPSPNAAIKPELQLSKPEQVCARLLQWCFRVVFF